MLSPRRVANRSFPIGSLAHAGLRISLNTRFLDGSFDARCPHLHRRVHRLLVLAASPLVAGFPLVGGLATLNFPNEAYLRFTFVTAHVFAFSGFARGGHQQQLPAEGVLRERRVGYGGERTIPTMNSFHSTSSTRLILAHRL